MDFRTLTQADLDAYQALRLRALREHPEAFASSYEEELAYSPDFVRGRLQNLHAPQSFIVAAAVDDQLIGMAGFRRHDKQKLRHKGDIWGVYVAPERRGKGVGKALMQRLESLARQNEGLEQLHLSVNGANRAAHHLYTRLGYEEYGWARESFRVGEDTYDEIFMVKFLHP